MNEWRNEYDDYKEMQTSVVMNDVSFELMIDMKRELSEIFKIMKTYELLIEWFWLMAFVGVSHFEPIEVVWKDNVINLISRMKREREYVVWLKTITQKTTVLSSCQSFKTNEKERKVKGMRQLRDCWMSDENKKLFHLNMP